jgi:hypothetical protein
MIRHSIRWTPVHEVRGQGTFVRACMLVRGGGGGCNDVLMCACAASLLRVRHSSITLDELMHLHLKSFETLAAHDAPHRRSLSTP